MTCLCPHICVNILFMFTFAGHLLNIINSFSSLSPLADVVMRPRLQRGDCDWLCHCDSRTRCPVWHQRSVSVLLDTHTHTHTHERSEWGRGCKESTRLSVCPSPRLSGTEQISTFAPPSQVLSSVRVLVCLFVCSQMSPVINLGS